MSDLPARSPQDIAGLRLDYTRGGLSESELAADPIEQFKLWFSVALGAGLLEPNAMTLATATTDGRPSARVVLLKGFDARGFVFYSNYRSRKGEELEANPMAALVFFWPELERQIRIEGHVEQVTAAESDAYFTARPAGSRIGAWASEQSHVIESREVVERRAVDLAAQFGGGDIPRPAYWGGYRVVPQTVEFWQGRPSRLHDRLRYRRDPTKGWIVERLSP